jgi:thioredoxin reductase (NADPH)
MDILKNEALLSWILGAILIFIFTIPYLLRWRRNQNKSIEKLEEAVRIGSNKPLMQHPIIDLSKCIGCGICTKVCPEGEVLGLVSGKAVLINGSKCVGHEVCQESCPVGGIEVGLGDISSREDIPQLSGELESNLKNVFIIGELGGLALIRNAINQGVRVSKIIAKRMEAQASQKPVVVVGAGPAGLSATLSLQNSGIDVILLDQNKPGGTILQYPRRKLVMVQPVELPGHGTMEKGEYSKEELLAIWDEIFDQKKPNFQSGHQLTGLEQDGAGYRLQTSQGTFETDYVILALGRRGTPRKLNIPGEDKAKVAYQLIDAESYQNQNILVVGGGDSAIETAVGLGQQKGNKVTLSYRKAAFTRIKTRNEEQLKRAVKAGWVNLETESNLVEIKDQEVSLQKGSTVETLPNDYIFIFAGGVPPFGLMESLGVQFGVSSIS